MTRRQHKPPRERRTLAQQLGAEVVCDLCDKGTNDPTIRGRWRTCPTCTRRLINIDAEASKEST